MQTTRATVLIDSYDRLCKKHLRSVLLNCNSERKEVIMWKNILFTAWRNSIRDKGYSLLNLLGLTISITASLLLVLYISHELSYENFHVKKDRIYRIVSHFQERDDEFSWASTQAPLAPQMKTDYAEVEEFVRIRGLGGNTSLTYNNVTQAEENLVLADSTYFDIFTHVFLEGDPKTCLDEPNSIVMTRSMAEKYFGQESALGKILKDAEGDAIKVSAVIEDLPRNTHLDFNGIISFNSVDGISKSWGSFFLHTYILLEQNVEGKAFSKKLAEVIAKYVDPIFKPYGVEVDYEMQAIETIHLYSKTDGEEGGGNIAYIYIFSIVVVFMLVIAAINYMNLATARSERRAREVGIRKVLGSYRWMLIAQFVSESLILTITALAISLFSIAFFFLDSFNGLTGREFYFEDLLQIKIIISTVGMVFLLGVLGGSYPAFYLSSFKPVSVLKGKFVPGKSTVPLRKILVVIQFAISITMIISTIVVYDQLSYLRNKDLGFSKDQVLVIQFTDWSMTEKYEVFKNYLEKSPAVISVGTANSSPGRGYDKNLLPVESEDGFVEKGVNLYQTDADYIPTLGIKILEGRNFDQKLASDSNAIIVNRLFAERMAWEDQSLGKRIRLSGPDSKEEYATVIGVMDNFHQLSLYQQMEPLVFFYREKSSFVHVKFKPENLKAFQNHLTDSWEKVYANLPMESYFLDQHFYESYEADEKRSLVFTLFSGITIFIACIGLLGLASFSAEQRTKEIGIRKVIGATEWHILSLLTKEFFVLVMISMVFAFGSAYFLMSRWLNESFVYHTEIKWLSFIYAALIALFFVLLTVGIQAYRAANRNPVNALRTE